MKALLRDLALFVFLVALTVVLGVGAAQAQEKKARKVQDVSFDGADVDGESRRPDGSYLAQKRGIDFVPLYNVRNQFDQKIKDSVDHLR